jgi:hypothetical protein
VDENARETGPAERDRASRERPGQQLGWFTLLTSRVNLYNLQHEILKRGWLTSAVERARTSKVFLPLAPQASASANFATTAIFPGKTFHRGSTSLGRFMTASRALRNHLRLLLAAGVIHLLGLPVPARSDSNEFIEFSSQIVRLERLGHIIIDPRLNR